MSGLAAFVRDVLESSGCAVEERGDEVEALLAPGLAAALGSGEHVVLCTGEAGHGRLACGYGSAALSSIADMAMASGRASACRVLVEPTSPRPPRLEGLNVSISAPVTERGEGWSLVGLARLTAVCDDSRQALVSAAVTVPGGLRLPAPDLAALELEADCRDGLEPGDLRRAFDRLVPALRTEASLALVPFRETVARRHVRDARRVERYFERVAADLERRLASRSSRALAAKLESLPAERASRRALLASNHSLRVRLDVVGLVALLSPCTTARFEVRRRKRTRTLELRHDAASGAWAVPLCDVCHQPVSSLALCDEASHIMCASCWNASGTGGRRSCLACGGGPPRTPWTLIRGDAVLQPDVPAARSAPPPPASGSSGTGAHDPAAPIAPAPSGSPGPVANPRSDVLEALRLDGSWMTSGQIRKLVPLTADELRRVLAPLVRDGLVVKKGQRRGVRYRAATGADGP